MNGIDELREAAADIAKSVAGAEMPGHAYIRREPLPGGGYRYWYRSPQGQEVSGSRPTVLPITYTMRADHPIAALRGKLLTGGTPYGSPVDSVRFDTTVNGKHVRAMIATNPGLAERVAEYQQQEQNTNRAKKETADALASQVLANVPGLDDLRKVSDAVADDRERYWYEHAHAQEHDMYRNPKPQDASLIAQHQELRKQYPRAALWMDAQRTIEGTSWADNTGRGAAASKCQRLLESGADVETARTALAERQEFTD